MAAPLSPLRIRVGLAGGLGIMVGLVTHFYLPRYGWLGALGAWGPWVFGAGIGLFLFLVFYIPLPENSQDSEGFDKFDR